jgi:hypothetical protein
MARPSKAKLKARRTATFELHLTRRRGDRGENFKKYQIKLNWIWGSADLFTYTVVASEAWQPSLLILNKYWIATSLRSSQRRFNQRFLRKVLGTTSCLLLNPASSLSYGFGFLRVLRASA